jgi:hypothetical protein
MSASMPPDLPSAIAHQVEQDLASRPAPDAQWALVEDTARELVQLGQAVVAQGHRLGLLLYRLNPQPVTADQVADMTAALWRGPIAPPPADWTARRRLEEAAGLPIGALEDPRP